jgi:hypothetical protein
MSLPFLKKFAQPGVSVSIRKPDEESAKEELKEGLPEGLEAAASDLLDAIEAKDIKRIAAALQAAFEISEASPHQEGEHVEESAE